MIYFDNASTTKIDSVVKDEIIRGYDEIFANPSSLHRVGLIAEKEIEKARKIISKKLNISAKNLYFVPSGTIANNSIIHSFDITGKNILVSEVEHSSIHQASLNTSAEVRYVKVNKYGFIDREDLIHKVDENTVLVSIIHVNNELGTINDINTLSKIAKEKNPNLLFHSDGVQAFNKIDISLNNIDFYTITAHKIHGPKGISALYIKDANKFNKLYFGGGQEKGIFSGTENVQGILGFAKASTLDNNFDKIFEINKYLREEISKIKGVIINSPKENASPFILNFCVEKIGAEILLHYLEMDEIYISTGSACSKGNNSRVIEAINVEDRFKDGCIRVSLSKDNTLEEAKEFVEKLEERIEMIIRIIK
ncbi:MAG: cysteine desulfurase family protein [Helcococcus sp.]|nr:cysteine desulfurase family protein [Helcococcus sp.]